MYNEDSLDTIYKTLENFNRTESDALFSTARWVIDLIKFNPHGLTKHNALRFERVIELLKQYKSSEKKPDKNEILSAYHDFLNTVLEDVGLDSNLISDCTENQKTLINWLIASRFSGGIVIDKAFLSHVEQAVKAFTKTDTFIQNYWGAFKTLPYLPTYMPAVLIPHLNMLTHLTPK